MSSLRRIAQLIPSMANGSFSGAPIVVGCELRVGQYEVEVDRSMTVEEYAYHPSEEVNLMPQIQVGDLHPEPTIRHACIGHEGSSFRNQILQIPNTNLDSQASQRLLASSYR